MTGRPCPPRGQLWKVRVRALRQRRAPIVSRVEATREMLASMPLHAITEVYGESGLRERFAFEIQRFGEADRERLESALDLAATLHEGQRRVREPYLNHLLRVAI